MRAMQILALDGHESLIEVDVPLPEPGPGQVRIAVGAAGCNFADTLICQGKYQVKPELPFSPGSEVAGTLTALGPDISPDVGQGLKVGSNVFATMPYGGYAAEVLADAREVYALADSMPLQDAAGFGIAYLTSYLALVDRGRLQAGETVLVHAAAGGVGLAALQIAVALGATVIASAGSVEKRALCTQHGASHVIDYRDEAWGEQVKDLTDGRGADVIYDPVGGDTFDASTRCLAFNGRLLVIGFASGRIPEIKLNRVMLKNIEVNGFHIGAYREHDPGRLQSAMAELQELHRRGKVTPVISTTYPLSQASAALAELAMRRTVGKIVLIP